MTTLVGPHDTGPFDPLLGPLGNWVWGDTATLDPLVGATIAWALTVTVGLYWILVRCGLGSRFGWPSPVGLVRRVCRVPSGWMRRPNGFLLLVLNPSDGDTDAPSLRRPSDDGRSTKHDHDHDDPDDDDPPPYVLSPRHVVSLTYNSSLRHRRGGRNPLARPSPSRRSPGNSSTHSSQSSSTPPRAFSPPLNAAL